MKKLARILVEEGLIKSATDWEAWIKMIEVAEKKGWNKALPGSRYQEPQWLQDAKYALKKGDEATLKDIQNAHNAGAIGLR